ncbi:MAG: sulfatase [Planctomycetaceae bacterium]
MFVRRCFLFVLYLALLAPRVLSEDRTMPNVVLVLADNLGTGDIGCYGSKLHRTPNIDQIAAEGTKFTSFYVTSGVCTPSRASLMTGCYAQRLNMHISDKGASVLQPVATKGLHPDEVTLAELFKKRGYRTACYGKWHLGDQLEFLPTRQGFDDFLGVPYSEDMVKELRPDDWPELPLMRNEEVIEAPVDCEKLTRIYTEAAVEFISESKERPFFLYLPMARPGSTKVVHVDNAFRGKSANGLYGDCVEELDWSMGEILKALKAANVESNTLVVWTSDNGAVNRNPQQGSNEPYKGWGYGTSEGGMRMPCVMRWPGMVPEGHVCDAVSTTLDFWPTFHEVLDLEFNDALKRDGHDMRNIWFAKAGTDSPYDKTGFFYYHMAQLQAVRRGPWKLYLPLEPQPLANGRKTKEQMLQLFNVREDVREDNEASALQPELVAQLLELAEQARADLGDQDRVGAGQRPAGFVENPTQRVLTSAQNQ